MTSVENGAGVCCRECGRSAAGDEFRASGLCQLCLNGPLPTRVTSPGSGDAS